MMRTMKGENDEVRRENRSSPSAEGIAWQMWHQKGQKCPKGTVPVRRSTVHDVLRSKSLFDFGKKQRTSLPLSRRVDVPDVVSGNGHEVCYLFSPKSYAFFFIEYNSLEKYRFGKKDYDFSHFFNLG